MEGIEKKVRELAAESEAELAGRFREIDEISQINTDRVLTAFANAKVSDAMFGGTTGYGYNDSGREALDAVFAEVFGAEAALVRQGFVNGTHAISAALFAALKPGQVLLSVTGTPYDTLRGVIGISGDYPGSLKYYGIGYGEVPLAEHGGADLPQISFAAANQSIGAVLIQRSRGYSSRRALSVAEIQAIIRAVKRVNPNAVCIVDNCYGEFTETTEPSMNGGGVLDVEISGADLIAGSLIKNPGGGLAPAGGYICGREDLVEAAAMRLTTPGIGGECGATLGVSRLLFQGLFLAPHTVAQAMKTAVFAAATLRKLGFVTAPTAYEPRSDIIQTVELGSPERMTAFCRGIQRGAPVDSFVTPVPSPMPGYDCDVIMAAGAFIQGSSIELSADGPMREPYRVYLQGGLTYESGKSGIIKAISEIMDLR